MKRARRFLILPLIMVLLVSCEIETFRRQYLAEYFETHLKIGDSQGQVEEFMRAEGWVFSYLDLAKRYTIYDPETKDNNHAWNVIHIYLDSNHQFKRVQVVTVYNGI